jgi:hypothetical protein
MAKARFTFTVAEGLSRWSCDGRTFEAGATHTVDAGRDLAAAITAAAAAGAIYVDAGGLVDAAVEPDLVSLRIQAAADAVRAEHYAARDERLNAAISTSASAAAAKGGILGQERRRQIETDIHTDHETRQIGGLLERAALNARKDT